MSDTPFSKRHGYTGRAKEITIHEDAPESLRFVVLETARELDWGPSALRTTICRVLRTPPDEGNWSEYPNIWSEVQQLTYRCDWIKVYDIIEALHARMAKHDEEQRRQHHRYSDDAVKFAQSLNDYFMEEGIGWQLVDGEIVTRGEEAFEAAVNTARAELEEAGRPTAAGRIHDALQALSRRPEPDAAGAISQAVAALECVAGDITGNDKAIFGDVLKSYPELFPGGLKKGLEGVWGYSCNEGARHGKEGKEPEREEAELIVGLAASVATYLNRKNR